MCIHQQNERVEVTSITTLQIRNCTRMGSLPYKKWKIFFLYLVFIWYKLANLIKKKKKIVFSDLKHTSFSECAHPRTMATKWTKYGSSILIFKVFQILWLRKISWPVPESMGGQFMSIKLEFYLKFLEWRNQGTYWIYCNEVILYFSSSPPDTFLPLNVIVRYYKSGALLQNWLVFHNSWE